MTDWYIDPAAPTCAHEKTVGGVLDLYGDGEVPAERCLACRAVRGLSTRVALSVVYRSEPLVTRNAGFPDDEKPKRKRPAYVPESWWDSGPLSKA